MTDTKLPPAIDLASRMNENTHSITRVDAVAAGKMLRLQHSDLLIAREAIKVLREALHQMMSYGDLGAYARANAVMNAKQALKDTENLA